jgi:proteasome accessory factor C
VSREDAGARLGRLLAILPWLASREQGATTEEIARRFNATVARVEKDLSLLYLVEPEAFSNVRLWQDDGRWMVDGLGHLGRPLRLTATEGFELMAAASSMLQVPGVDPAGPLASALGKVARALGGDVDGLEVHLPRPQFLADAEAACAESQRIEIEYYAASTDEVTHRAVDPLAVFTAEGRWHVIAWCHLAGGERDFRIDRIRSLRRMGERFEKREPTMKLGQAFQPASTVTAVRLELSPEQRWVLETYSVRDVEECDGRVQLTLDVAGEPWIERLLLRLGPTARVSAPEAWFDLGARAATRLLRVYARESVGYFDR